MIDHSSNPWISKSPLKSFNVWLKDQNGKKGTLVVTSGAIYRKQNILSLEEVPAGDGKTKQKLRINYATECYACDAGEVAVTSASFPIIVGALDGKLVHTDKNVKKFVPFNQITIEDDDQTDSLGNPLSEAKLDIDEKQEVEKSDSEKKTNPIPDVVRFVPLWYLDADVDAFGNLILKNQKWIVESDIVLGKDVLSEEEEILKEPKPEEEEEVEDPCEKKLHPIEGIPVTGDSAHNDDYYEDKRDDDILGGDSDLDVDSDPCETKNETGDKQGYE
ncbi:MAG: hypothetical protein PHS78_10515 [Aliarcobacter skirrowii]|nr:hypothetical protein [Aliarcobacter skirrowii]